MSVLRINDPVQGLIIFPEKIAEVVTQVIKNPIFKRLKYIKQLGFMSDEFLGANHTRFEHCIGVAWAAYQIATKLDLSEKEVLIITLAGLLHDIGHGPFSHTFEGIWKGTKITHETLSREILPLFKDVPFLKPEDVQNDIYQLIMGTHDNIPNIINNNVLDADRIDYMMRDSYYLGVPFGKIDKEWLIDNVRLNPSDKSVILFNPKADAAVKSALFNRKLLRQYIYKNKHKIEKDRLFIKFWVTFLDVYRSSVFSTMDKYIHPEISEFLHHYTDRYSKDDYYMVLSYIGLTDYVFLKLIQCIATCEFTSVKQYKKLITLAKQLME